MVYQQVSPRSWSCWCAKGFYDFRSASQEPQHWLKRSQFSPGPFCMSPWGLGLWWWSTTTWVAETAQVHHLIDLRVRSLRSGCGQGWFLLRTWGRTCLRPLTHSWRLAGHLCCSLAIDALFAHAHSTFSPLCVSVPVSLCHEDTSHWVRGPSCSSMTSF